MKIRAIKRYVDRYSKKIIEEGTELDVAEERAKELIRQQVAERVVKASHKADQAEAEG
ncbi:MAG: hypothetical protein K2N01_12765 [Lachnospiraceae bacterium]|nr:hypothetical protein [Lachnospiraceae bacterium]